MDMKRGKVFVGAVVAISLGSFAVPFGSIASASTGTGSAPQASRYIQLAQAEQSETEEKTERKVTESTDNPAVMAPNATVVAPGTTVDRARRAPCRHHAPHRGTRRAQGRPEIDQH